MDSRLPGGALPLGALHEIAGGGNGAIDGAAAALFAAGIAARTRGKVLWCLTRLDLFAPALAQAGLNSDRVIYLEGGDEKTILACFEEGLRHGGLGAVVGEVARLPMTASRRTPTRRRRLGDDRHRAPTLEAAGLIYIDWPLREDNGFVRILRFEGQIACSWESVIEAEALRNDRSVEEGQGELVVFHGERS